MVDVRDGQPEPTQRYTVTGVAGRDPVTLDDFVGATTLTFADDARNHRLVGAGLLDDDVVQFHDRDLESASEDAKIWTIVQRVWSDDG